MKVYLMSSPRGKKQFGQNYKMIYDTLVSLGCNMVTDFIVRVEEEEFYESDIVNFSRDTVRKLKQADICIFEASIPSLAVGHLISVALQNEKPVIALYQNENVPFFLSGLEDEKIQIVDYSAQNIKSKLQESIAYAQEVSDVRFNFFISPRHVTYLDSISKKRKIPKSVYLRDLIEKDMDRNEEYQNQ
jgi:hypothetical protein